MDSGQDHQKQQRGSGKSFFCLHHAGLLIRGFRVETRLPRLDLI